MVKMEDDTSEWMHKVAEKYTLIILHTGSDSINYAILKALPTTVPELMDRFNLTKMPVNNRINRLEKVGLIKRVRGEGKVKPTEMTPLFIQLINEIESEVVEKLPQLLNQSSMDFL